MAPPWTELLWMQQILKLNVSSTFKYYLRCCGRAPGITTISTVHLRSFAAHLLAFSPVTVPESMEWLLCFIPCHRPRFCTRTQKASRVTIHSTIGTVQSAPIRVDRYIHVFLSYWITSRGLFEVFLLKQQWRILSLPMLFCARILGFL